MALDQKSVEQFRHGYLFSQLTPEELRQVAEHGSVRELAAGETLFVQGEACHNFYMVQSGMIKVYRISPEGEERILELIRPPQIFAEAAMFMGGRYPVHAAALEPSRLFAFDSANFIAQMRANVELCFRLMAGMSRRMHSLINEIDQLALHSGTQRLIQYLLEQLPQGTGTSPVIRLMVAKSVLASRLSIQPETFSRILARLRSEGLIEVHDETVLLKDVAALRRLSQS